MQLDDVPGPVAQKGPLVMQRLSPLRKKLDTAPASNKASNLDFGLCTCTSLTVCLDSQIPLSQHSMQR